MGPSLATLLCLRFCVVQALQSFHDLPPPVFEVDPQYPVPLGQPLKLHCMGPQDSSTYRIYKEAVEEPLSLNDSSWESKTPRFEYPETNAQHAGRLRCVYEFHSFWSKPSNPLEVQVSGFYEKPLLWAVPGPSVPQGHNFTIHCNSSVGLDSFVLYHGKLEYEFKTIRIHSIKKNEAVFFLHNKTEDMNGRYRCYGYMSSEPHRWSTPSDVLLLSGGLSSGWCIMIHLIHVVLALAIPCGSC
ncbi:platelet glycoprotein VI-like isoform X2 [Vombatus ursinus]|uniref:Ig-like domain-containing protein n=1 Tax=Vombatus ursinus TaxID=29139 RepID=A0A4X2JYL5_VOMUR|nr:platelet glycoprotein VI-like isoform X2 [Vombatus ursinus]